MVADRITKKTAEEIEAIYAEVEAQTDRGAAIIAAAIVDDLLTEALRRRLILTTTLAENLFNFDKNGPLANLTQKIDLAFAVGMIRSSVRNDLHNIRRIRNRFAHKIEPLTFADQKISQWCALLATGENLVLPRHRYVVSCIRITSILSVLSQLEMRLTPVRAQPGMEEQIDAVLNRLLPDT
jgi:DNA-binding MltR family transcriptional regulator